MLISFLCLESEAKLNSKKSVSNNVRIMRTKFMIAQVPSNRLSGTTSSVIVIVDEASITNSLNLTVIFLPSLQITFSYPYTTLDWSHHGHMREFLVTCSICSLKKRFIVVRFACKQYREGL